MKRLVLAIAAGAMVALPAAAQDLKRPETWKVRLDQGHGGPVPDSLWYVSMPPGWHVTTGRHSAIFWDPAWTATGNYTISSTMFLFPGSRQEGYGLMLAGRDLEGDGRAYLYFLLRRDGKYLIKQRQGAETDDLVPWTDHAAITRLAPDGKDNVKNVLAIEATTERIRFLVNGQELTSLARAEVGARAGGLVGLRMNHHIDVHVADVKIEKAGG